MIVDRDQAILHLIAITALMLFVLFLVLEDVERLKRITSPRLIFVATKEAASFEETAPMEADIIDAGD